MRIASFVVAFTLSLVALVVAGCGGTRACKDGTVLVTVNLDGPAAGADSLALAITVGGGAAKAETVALPAGATSGTVEVDFPSGYPSGQTVSLVATAQKSGIALATTSGAVALSSSCGQLTLDFANAASDGGGSDAGLDACVPAVTSCPATVACGKVADGCGGTIDCGPCALFSVEPSFASTSDTVTLEGIFGANPVVNFPGGPTANATVVGPNRLQVLVPPGVGAGALTVTSGGVTTAGQPFFRAAFNIGVGNFQPHYDQADWSKLMPQLTKPRWGLAVTSTGDHLYALGGSNNTERPFADGEVARINADGSVGGFVPLASTMTTPRVLFTAEQIGGFVYVIGGRDNHDNASASVERAPINADGTLGAFVSAGTLVTPRFQHASVVIGDWLYVIGGYTGPKCGPPVAQSSVERAKIMPDGTLGAFADAGVALTKPRVGPAVVVNGSYVYAVGGASDPSSDYAVIAGDGTLMSFVDAKGALTGSFKSFVGAYVIGGQLIAFGDHLYSAAFNGDGTLMPFTQLSFPTGDASATYAPARVGAYLYLFGGGESFCCSACFTSSPTATRRASLDAGTAVTGFTQVATPALKTERQSPAVAIVGNNVYLLGGQSSGMPFAEMATVQNGALGSFDFAPSVTLATTLGGMGAAVVGQQLYLVGGRNSSNSAQTTVQVAPIHPDNTLGSFALATQNGTTTQVTLSTPRAGATVVGIGSRLCAFGGDASANGTFECASVNVDGTLASGFTNPPSALALQVVAPHVLVLGANVYLVASGHIQSAPLDSSGLPGTFTSGSTTPLIDGSSAFVAGTDAYFAGGFNGLDFSQAVFRSTLDPTTFAPAALSASPSTLSFKRSGQVNIVVGNTVYLLGGTISNNAAETETAELR